MSDAGQGISPNGFLAVLWTLTAITTVLFIGRLLIRSILLKSFHLDDIFSSLAWLLMTIAIILATVSNPLNYQSSSILVGERPQPSPDELREITITLRKWNVAGQTLFWTSLYCVKVSFMFLYRIAFGTGHGNRRAWSIVVVYIILSYGVCLIGVFGQCGDVRNLFSYEQCLTPYVASLDAKLIWVDLFFNVTTDLAVICLPLPVIWRLNMHTRQKLAVTGICSLAIITVAFETVRTVKLYSVNFTLTNLYSYLELIIAVLTSMLPSFRFLISPTDKDREYRRLFWSRLTLRSYHSASSGYSMPDLTRRRTPQGERNPYESATDLVPPPPLPTSSIPVHPSE
ncbi:hypothetical protein F5Y17DRAFT_350038 [Xylariaceae sp. FL0594]|nr:hypothetical protein F5Y17DRAFT_350038 [Xylariaceae sp. FL0594]